MKKLKLNALANNALSEKESKNIKGGAGCGCGCWAAGTGGSSVNSNGVANSRWGLTSPKGLITRYTDWDGHI
jgi:natural product precursor